MLYPSFLPLCLFPLTGTWAITNCRCLTALCFPNYNISVKCEYALSSQHSLESTQDFPNSLHHCPACGKNSLFPQCAQKAEPQWPGRSTWFGPVCFEHHNAHSVSKTFSWNFYERRSLQPGLEDNPLPELSLLVKVVTSLRPWKLLNLLFFSLHLLCICVTESKLPVVSLSLLKSNYTSAVESFGVFRGKQVAHSLGSSVADWHRLRLQTE